MNLETYSFLYLFYISVAKANAFFHSTQEDVTENCFRENNWLQLNLNIFFHSSISDVSIKLFRYF